MMNKRIISSLLLTLCLFLFSTLELSAGSVNVSVSAPGTVYKGNTVEVTVSFSNVNAEGGITGVGGQINFDSSYLKYESYQSLSSINVTYAPGTSRFAGLSVGGQPITGNTGVIRLVFRALQTGNTTVSFSNASISDSKSNPVTANNASKSISITEPPSANANLKSLSVSNTNISLNNLSSNVGKDVTSVNISATAEDAGARVSGTGQKSLNYGKNTFTITVTAPSGATRSYTVTINREDPRSNNANLSSLKVSGGDLKPGFGKNTTTYSMTVPFSVSSLDIKATAEDKNAKVQISGNTNLPSEATTPVIIKVTAENGNVKTYTINVTREKDPNKPKSNNNYLSSITTNIGILSPVFDKEKTNYVVYLPYEVDKIELNVEVDDKEYGQLERTGPDTLNVGINRYEFKVTAEDGTTKSYIVNVIRGASVEGGSSNVLLKELNIDNGSLDKKFKSDVNVYRYSKKKGFKLSPVPEDENTKVSVLEFDGVYTILLETSNGEANVYTLVPEEETTTSNNIGIIITIVVASIPFIGGGTFLGYKYGMKKMLSKVKNLAQTKVETPEEENVVYEEKPKSKKGKKSKKQKDKEE